MEKPVSTTVAIVAVIAIIVAVVSVGGGSRGVRATVAACRTTGARIFPHGAMMWEGSTDWSTNHQFFPDRDAYTDYVVQCMTAHGYSEDLRKVECQPHYGQDMAFDRWCYKPNTLVGGTMFDLTVWLEYQWCRLNRPPGTPWPFYMTMRACHLD